MGLLDNPDTAGNLSLAAGLLGGGNFGQAMQRGLMGYQDTSNTIQDRALKRQAQEIAIQQNAAQLKDMLWKRQMGNSILGLDGNGGQAATDPSQGGPAPSTGMGNATPLGAQGQPTGQSQGTPQSQPQGSSAPSGTFAGIPRAAVGLSLAGMPELAKFAESAAQPLSDIGKILRDGGIDRNSALGQQLLQGSMAKANYIAPVSGRPGGYIVYPNGTIEQLPHVPDSFTAIKGEDGKFHMEKVDGGLTAMQDSATATALGKAAAEPTVRYQGTTPVFSTKAQDVGLANGQNPMQGLPAAQPGMTSSFQGPAEQVMRQIAGLKDPQERANAFDAYSRQMTGGGAAPAPQATPVPTLGAVSNANAAQTASAKTMQDSYEKLRAGNASAQAGVDAIKQMQILAAQKNGLVQSGSLMGGPLGTLQTSLSPSAAEYEKLRANLIGQLAQQNGANGTDAGRALMGEAVPDFGKPKEAIKAGLETQKNQILLQQLKGSALTPIFQAGDSKAYTTFENQFDQNISPSMVPLLTMPAGKSRGMLLQNAAKDPAMRARLTWAAENGLLK